MSLEQTLDRIAIALEKLIELQTQRGPSEAMPEKPATGTTPVVPAVPPISPAAIGTPPGPPVAPAAPAAPPGPPVAPAAPAGPPATPQPAAPAMQVVPSLDDIRALATDFHRAHPERAAEVVGILASVNAQSLSEIPPDRYSLVHSQLKALVGG